MIPAPRVFEAGVVDDEPFDQKLPQMGGDPLAKLDATRGADAVPHGEDRVERVVVHEPLDHPRALGPNYPVFPDSCVGRQFAVGKDVLEMLVDRPDVLLEQFSNLTLRQPKRLVVDPQLEPRRAVRGCVEHQPR